jgi:hypothetical protein
MLEKTLDALRGWPMIKVFAAELARKKYSEEKYTDTVEDIST